MKPARLLLIFLGVLVLTGGICLAASLIPAVQRTVLLRLAAKQPGLRLEIGTVSAGFSHVALRSVTASRRGVTLRLDQLEADYSLWALLFSRRLEIHRLEASGIVVDASRISPAKAQAAVAGAPAAAPGLLGNLQLPVALVLDEVQLTGRVLLPGLAGGPPIDSDCRITGGKFAPGQEGALLLVTAVNNPAPGARVSTLNFQVNLRATQTAQRTFSRVGLNAVADAAGQNLSDQSQLKFSAELMRDAAGENYSVSVDTLLRGAPENVLAVHAALPAGGREYTGDWTLKARLAQLEPFFLGGALPEFEGHGGGRFAFAPATGAMSLQGKLDAAVSRLELLQPALRAVGAVNLSAQFDVAAADGIAQLHQLDVSLAGDQPVLELHAAQAAELNFREKRLQVGPTGATGEVLNLNVTGLPLAWVRPFVHGVDISGGTVTGRISITADQDRLTARATAPLRIGALSIVQRGRLLLDKADLSLAAEAVLTPQDLRATISEVALKTPAGDSFTAQAVVSIPVSPDPAITVGATYALDLPKLLGPWLPLGRVKAAGGADFAVSRAKLELRQFTTDVTDGTGAPLFKVVALHPFALELATLRATTAENAPADLLRLTLGRLPLDHLPLNTPGAKLGGVVEQGEFVLAVDGDKLTLRALSPVKLAEVSLAQGGAPALADLRIEAQPSLEFKGLESVMVKTGDISVRTGEGTTLLTAKGETSRSAADGVRGNVTFNLEVPALATQPLFADAQAVTQGRATGEVRVALGSTSQVEARVTVNGLVAREGGQTLPVANLSFRAVAGSDGRITVQAPLLLDRAGQRSDLNFSLELVPVRGVFGIDGKLTGDHVELADALAVLGVFLASAAPDTPPPPPDFAAPRVTADAKAAWSRFAGDLTLDVKSVTRGTEWTMTGLTGQVKIEPLRLALGKLEAAFGEKSRFAAKGEVRFETGANPYALTGDFSLDEFDAGKFFKALEPNKPPTVEGLFSVQGHLLGDGETLSRTFERTRGAFELTSRQGVFRGLQRTGNKVSMTSKAVELGASVLGSIFGSEKATKAAEKVAGSAYFVDQLAQSIGELNYDQLNLRLVRAESLNLALEDFSLVSPDLRLLGKGTVNYVAGKPLLEQPLSVTLSLAGRNKVEDTLGKLRLLDGNRDELGYAKTRQPLTVTGTLAKPDPTAFFTKIAAAKLGELLSPEN